MSLTENINDTYKNNEQQMHEDIKTGEMINTLKCTHKWKSPGLFKIRNIWLHNLSSPPTIRTKLISEIIKESEKCMTSWQKE